MPQTILYVGLDVDDTRYHDSAFHKDTGEVIDLCDLHRSFQFS
ncbi:MAG: hypothetical protein R3351_01905 [Nitrospirales bacterium]|nr:hypothetical protein [Nitrospirales bacterium]